MIVENEFDIHDGKRTTAKSGPAASPQSYCETSKCVPLTSERGLDVFPGVGSIWYCGYGESDYVFDSDKSGAVVSVF
jgi:hypothetical protein